MHVTYQFVGRMTKVNVELSVVLPDYDKEDARDLYEDDPGLFLDGYMMFEEAFTELSRRELTVERIGHFYASALSIQMAEPMHFRKWYNHEQDWTVTYPMVKFNHLFER